MASKLRVLTIVALLFLLCGAAVQATTLHITVKDSDDGSVIKGASIYIDGSYEGTTGSSGTYSYYHSDSDDFTLKVTKSNYDNWVEEIGGDDTSVTVRMTSDTLALKVTVYDADSFGPVSGIWVNVKGDDGTSDSDRTDSSGLAEFDVTKDEDYTVTIDADGYASFSQDVSMSDEARSVQYWLYPTDRFAFKVLDADGDPISGATVTVGGTVKGTTGSEGTVATTLDTGESYLVKVTADGYQDYSQEMYIGENAVLTTINLVRSTSSVFLSVFDASKSPVSGATVTLDGDEVGQTDSYGRYTFSSLVAGTHTITVTATGYSSWSKTIESTDEQTDLVAELSSVSVPVSVLVETADHAPLAGVAISVNGEAGGVTATDGTLSLDLAPGTYNITGTLDGYVAASSVQQISTGSSGESCLLTLRSVGLPLGIIGVVVVVVLVLVVVGGVVMVRKTRHQSSHSRRPNKRHGF